MVRALSDLFYLISTFLWGKIYYPHIKNEKTEAQKEGKLDQG